MPLPAVNWKSQARENTQLIKLQISYYIGHNVPRNCSNVIFFHVTEISIHNILFQSLKFKDVTFGLSSAPTFVPYSIFSDRNTILIKEAVMLLVTTAIVAIPVQVHKKANDRAGMDFGILSPYLKENHHHKKKILIQFRSFS